jgi:hypothetical protein
VIRWIGFAVGVVFVVLTAIGVIFTLVLPRARAAPQKLSMIINRATHGAFVRFASRSSRYETVDSRLAPVGPVALLSKPAVEACLSHLPEGHLQVEHAPADQPHDRLEAGFDIVAGFLDGSFNGPDVDEAVDAERSGPLPQLLGRREVPVGGGDRDQRPLGGLGHRRRPTLPHQVGGSPRQRRSSARPLIRATFRGRFARRERIVLT